jgi:hypothetical protein
LETRGASPDGDALCQSARAYESLLSPQIRAIEEENHRQGVLMGPGNWACLYPGVI